MLSRKALRSIGSEAYAYWTAEVKKPEIIAIAKGKEIGHKLADLVDEKTTALLTVKYLSPSTNTTDRGRSGLGAWAIFGCTTTASTTRST